MNIETLCLNNMRWWYHYISRFWGLIKTINIWNTNLFFPSYSIWTSKVTSSTLQAPHVNTSNPRNLGTLRRKDKSADLLLSAWLNWPLWSAQKGGEGPGVRGWKCLEAAIWNSPPLSWVPHLWDPPREPSAPARLFQTNLCVHTMFSGTD